ncbi:hypothetical protein RhiirA5_430665 [Rhizophagus irregularis]|uniref:Uncharacterized protein n=2 Tax=Rhizophagus irregularis TaxID=588596 RepID=A0A2N0NWC2_9GLOM|nr:hypothetical protein RhiirA5_435346 [Rhizophagus irregularis]PKB98880.1 hypothetical protein RhiirA5_430665 [Rhizophagus irregularis]UZO11404.1 hypothetical protein OCT59_002973 [Rhizophagus irregularis]GBC36731.1 hypothetical protein GLOIN_2v1769441 [Rhizophagus irregularis DAOM 181602=DAOM 197198]CAB4481404.1 unnamed protein product [Rhizophagus irregularis]
MASKNYGQKTCGTPPCAQNICFENNACKIIKESKSPKICSNCKETSDSIKLFSSKVNKIEEATDNFYKNPIKKNKINQFSIFNAKFTLNNAPCELEYDLSNLFRKFT